MTENEFFDLMAKSIALCFLMDEIFQQHNLPFAYQALDTMLPLLPAADRKRVETLNEQYLQVCAQLCNAYPQP